MPPPALHPDPSGRRLSRRWRSRFAFALPGCSLIKLGYGQASPLAFRWLDRYRRLGRRAVAAGAHRARRDARLASAHAAARLRRSCSAAPRPRCSATRRPERMCALGGRDPQPHRSCPAVSRADDRRRRADAHAGAARAHREPLRRQQRRVARRAPAGEPAAATQGRGQARAGARRDALRRLRRRRSASSIAQSVGDLAVQRRARLRGAARATAGRARLLRRLRATHRGRDEALEQVRAYLGSVSIARRARRIASMPSGSPAQLRASRARCTTRPARRSGARQSKRLKGYEGDLRSLIAEAAS